MKERIKFEKPILVEICLEDDDILCASGRFGATWAGEEEDEWNNRRP